MADYIKLPEVARRLDVSEKTARRMVKAGKLPAVFIGGAYRVSEEDLAGFLESSRVDPGKAQRRSSLEPSLNDVLEDLRRTTASFERFHNTQQALDEFREGWETRLEAEDFDKAALEEAGRTIKGFWPAVTASADAEIAELERFGTPPEEVAAQSVLLPAIARLQALAEKVNTIYSERFRDAPAPNVIWLTQRKAS